VFLLPSHASRAILARDAMLEGIPTILISSDCTKRLGKMQTHARNGRFFIWIENSYPMLPSQTHLALENDDSVVAICSGSELTDNPHWCPYKPIIKDLSGRSLELYMVCKLSISPLKEVDWQHTACEIPATYKLISLAAIAAAESTKTPLLTHQEI